ncbi:MAG: DUF7286 family protein [Halobacteriota archaeon]
MTFVADERGRVPFALVAALLLVSSLTYTSGLVHEEPAEPVSPRLVEEATAEARIQLGSVARTADRHAAAEPVTTVATTRLGRVLADDPFERSLELRIAVLARQDVVANRTADGSRVEVTVPPITDEADARRALREVSTTHLTDDRYRVRLENVSVRVHRDGRVVDEDTIALETTVALPSMAVHQRAGTFERRLSAGVTEPGLERGLTTRLFALAWVRGYAQYGGAPISNVVANRHVGVLTNDVLVDQQVATFGRADPDSRRGVARAGADVAVADGVGGMESLISAEMGPDDEAAKPEGAASLGAIDTPSVMDDSHEYDVGRGADETFVDFVDGSGLDDALSAAYRARIRPEATARQTDYSVRHDGSRPANGTPQFSYTTTDRTVRGDDRTTARGSTVLRYERTVTVTETEHTYWTVNRTVVATTSTERERTYDVSIDVRCRYDAPDAPGGRVTRACPFGDSARADLEDEATSAVAGRFGGVDSIAEDAVRGDPSYRWRTVSVDPPRQARERAYASTADLRDDLRDVDVAVEPASMASTANPASRLSENVHRRHDRLVAAPRSYRSAAAVAEYVARERYLDAMEDDLDDHSSTFAGMQDALGDVMADHAVPSEPPAGEPDTLPPIASSVEAEPRYLSLEAERGSPNLAARNVNVFTVPYGDAADSVSGVVGGDDESTSLSTATSTLVATNRALAEEPDPQLRAERDGLRVAIRQSLDAVREEQRRALRESAGLSRTEATRALDAGYDRHGSTASRATAVVEGTISGDVAASLPDSLSASERDRAKVALRVATTEARDAASVSVDESTVSAATDRLRPHLREGVDQAVRVGTHRAVSLGKRRAMRSAAAEIPAGLPLTPVPGQWYATANVWVVSVEGGYDRFTVETPRATPIHGDDGTISYVRESAAVTLDVDDDGIEETIGRNEPIDLSADTGVVVVVPPGPAGVGDTNGVADERSPGW